MSGADPLDAMFGAESDVVREEAPVTEQAQTAPEPQPEPQPTEAKDTPRDERGRFAPKTEGEQPQEAQPQEGEERGYVPVTAFKKLREESKRLKAELNELKQRSGSQPQQPPQYQPQEALPPEVQREIDQRNEYYNTHEYMARLKHGDDAIDEAQEWFGQVAQADPAWANEIRSHRFPYEALVNAYQAQKKAEAFQDLMAQGFDPTNPLPWAEQLLRAQRAQHQQAQPAPQQPSRPPPRSLASQPSSGGQDVVPSGPGQAFDSLFHR